ncbi:hypothetical protein CR513_19255, partial [Mucuna pruriens]
MSELAPVVDIGYAKAATKVTVNSTENRVTQDLTDSIDSKTKLHRLGFGSVYLAHENTKELVSPATSNNQVLFGSFVRLTIHISLRYSYDDCQRNDYLIVGTKQALPKKCRDPEIFLVPCTIGDCSFADALPNLGSSINVMPTSIYKPLNCIDLEPTGMTIQLVNRSVVQPLSVLEDVLVQVDELIFLANFYVMDMEDETPTGFDDR